MTVDLKVIADVFERDAERCEECGCIESAKATRQCVATLRLPRVSHHLALAAISDACRVALKEDA
jgi:hypothetical protein